jgi:hypothetical protein
MNPEDQISEADRERFDILRNARSLVEWGILQGLIHRPLPRVPREEIEDQPEESNP